MTTADIADVKYTINQQLRKTCAEHFVGERLDSLTLDTLRATVRSILEDVARSTGWGVVRELYPEVHVTSINGLTVLFNATTPRSEKFLLGEAF